MKIIIEIPDTPELDAIPDEHLAAIVNEAVRGTHWYEYAGIDVDLGQAWAQVADSAWTRKPERSFLAWLKQQRSREDMVGSLAQDAAKDPNSPNGRATKGQWRDYLGGAQHLAAALDLAWDEFLCAAD